MKEPIWISREWALAVHEELLVRFGGSGGIRDEGMLESALSRPVNLFAYEEPSLFVLAAAYTSGIVRNHPFVDGNKRTGFMAAYTFLGLNGQHLKAPEEAAVLRTLALAAGELSEDDFGKWLAESCAPAADANA